MANWVFNLSFIAAVGTGMVAGVLFAFSAFVMKALSRISAVYGVSAMQSINIVVQNPLCSLLFFGTGLISLTLIVMALLGWGDYEAGYLFAGGLSYVFALLVTGAFNVPLNNKLASVKLDTQGISQVWDRFYAKWIVWNHVRTAACVVSSVFFILAMLEQI
ncbi:DUF1772 domain-containing protein [Cohnella boryungensis]|uniref:DUF1772 domain-containing protein n=1 Tax=Cohnella boryungensis TaxID=768479 RepID=A0ABV8SA05_9BACL